MPPEGLYIHIPYCYDKCTYCDFNSAPIEGARPERYLVALKQEIDGLPTGFAPRTVFLGGGTPTALAAGQLDELLTHLEHAVNLARVKEFSVEANPGTVTPKKLDVLRAHGVNRISIGAQSFNATQLKQLGRIHDASQIVQTVQIARKAGFDNLSLDLIFALPDQTLGDWNHTLEQAVALKPEHISAYCLTYEDGTPLTASAARGEVAQADEDTELAMLRRTVEGLRQAGYHRYEISNYAQPGRECAHNLIYWRNEEYYGLGAGATSYINGRRYRNANDPADYARRIANDGDGADFEETLAPDASFREAVALGLRMCDGVAVDAVETRTGLRADAVYDGEVEALVDGGLLVREPDRRIRLTPRGLEVADEVMMRLI